MTRPCLAVLALALCAFLFAADDAFPDIPHKDLAAAVKTGKVTLIDCNGTLKYNKSRIPGALNFTAVRAELAKHLPADKSALIVAYCGDPDCNAYTTGARAAVDLGYTNVKFYSGGIAGWLKENEKFEGTLAK